MLPNCQSPCIAACVSSFGTADDRVPILEVLLVNEN